MKMEKGIKTTMVFYKKLFTKINYNEKPSSDFLQMYKFHHCEQ